MSGKFERSSTFAASSTVAGGLFESAEDVSSADPFFDPHPKKQTIAHATNTFCITLREQNNLGSARGPRAGFGGLAETDFRNIKSISDFKDPR